MTDFNKILSKYGESVTFEKNGKTKTVKALLQPLHYRFKTYFMPKRLPQGLFDNRHYLLLASSDFTAESLMKITCGGKNYLVLSCESYRINGKTLYVRAVLTACTDGAEDDYDSN